MIHVGAAHADDRSAAGVRGILLPGRRQAEPGDMFNAGVQRQLPWTSVLDVSYVGTRGKNIFVSRNINVPLPAPATSTRGGRTSRWRRTSPSSISAPAMRSPGITRFR